MLVRPLRNGDIDTVLAVFHRLSDESRRRRFNGGKARLPPSDLVRLGRWRLLVSALGACRADPPVSAWCKASPRS
jgi:hypothetical protein